LKISDKQKGLTRSVCISFVTFDGFTNLFPVEENDDTQSQTKIVKTKNRMKMRREAKTKNAQALCKEEMKREETSQRGKEKGNTGGSWHKTKEQVAQNQAKARGL